jgi:hypothetical protein
MSENLKVRDQSHRRYRRRWEYNIKMVLTEMM